ncbi:Uncharacterised protein [Vibrio cholerae]|uniref:Uncharacterized protein n=1 Tax=Vibrio cholerae TaxID=666 RepID=A0A655WFT3_VIBCL|nr:Uncharacterised protein [Vibrio cholerae]CSB89183.1 Uncharacterised protein [Vibrio cholerae]CSC94391.1 Uncharacterised protein [Vibrio cholerae]
MSIGDIRFRAYRLLTSILVGECQRHQLLTAILEITRGCRDGFHAGQIHRTQATTIATNQ